MNQPGNTWVYVVDDDHHVLTAFRRLLETVGYKVATFDSPLAFLAGHDPALPGCALLDVGMTGLSGLETQTQLLALGDTRPVIFVTGHDDVATGVLAMKSGARDYLLKPVMDDVLLAAVEAAVQADMVNCRKRVELREQLRRWQSLTPREREVMTHVVRGRLNKQIAGDLNIVEKTVKVHRARVMEKMGVRSVAALVHIAERLPSPETASKPAEQSATAVQP
ncbi:MAG: LuxR family transcriptional regulator [Alphaproteobacteria bacterium]|nr:LuxR family transcriptional regulator [Alphaproteobacteria bacterium]